MAYLGWITSISIITTATTSCTSFPLLLLRLPHTRNYYGTGQDAANGWTGGSKDHTHELATNRRLVKAILWLVGSFWSNVLVFSYYAQQLRVRWRVFRAQIPVLIVLFFVLSLLFINTRHHNRELRSRRSDLTSETLLGIGIEFRINQWINFSATSNSLC